MPAEVTSVYDGDTINVRAEIWPNLYWEGAVRIDGIDTPEIGWRAKCPEESALAVEAKQLVEDAIGIHVLIINPEDGKFAGRVLGDILTSDGILISTMLIANDLAREYHGGRREGWCSEEEIR